MVEFKDYPIVSVSRGGKVVHNREKALHNYRTVVTGATGSGKSTFALVKLITEVCSPRKVKGRLVGSSESVVLVQPSEVNVGNVIFEFNTRIPRVLGKGHGLPMARVLTKTGTIRDGNFYITDVATMLRLINRKADIAHVHVVVDECHQQTSEMVRLVAFLSVAREFSSVTFITATLPGVGTGQGANRGTVTVERKLNADIAVRSQNLFLTSPLNPIHYTTVGSGIVCYFAASYAQALTIQRYIGSMHVTVLSEHTTQGEYLSYLRQIVNRDPKVIILTPVVDSGVTIPANVFIDLGYTSGKMIVNRVVVDEVRPISDATRRQRMGRCGRLFEGVYISDPTTGVTVEESDVELYTASAAVLLKAYGYAITDLGLSKEWKYIDAAGVDDCVAAVAVEGEPALSLMKCMIGSKSSKWTQKEREAFVLLFGAAMKIFTYGDSVYVAPVFDLTNPRYNPYDMVPKQQVVPVAQLLAASTTVDVEQLSDDDYVDVLVRNMGLIHREVFDTLIDLMDNDATWECRSRESLTALYGKMADVLIALGKVSGYEVIDEFKKANNGKYSHRMGVKYQGKELGFTVKAIYCDDNHVYLPSKFMPELKKRLRATASLGLLLDDPGRAVDLQPLVEKYGSIAKIIGGEDVKKVPKRKMGRKPPQQAQTEPKVPSRAPTPDMVLVGEASGEPVYLRASLTHTISRNEVAYIAETVAADTGEDKLVVAKMFECFAGLTLNADTVLTEAMEKVRVAYRDRLLEYVLARDVRLGRAQMLKPVEALCLVFA